MLQLGFVLDQREITAPHVLRGGTTSKSRHSFHTNKPPVNRPRHGTGSSNYRGILICLRNDRGSCEKEQHGIRLTIQPWLSAIKISRKSRQLVIWERSRGAVSMGLVGTIPQHRTSSLAGDCLRVKRKCKELMSRWYRKGPRSNRCAFEVDCNIIA